MPNKREINNAIGKLQETANRYGIKGCYIVGGYPRAIVMGNVEDDVHDLDVASAWPREALKLGELFASKYVGGIPETYHRTGTIVVNYNGIDLEFQGVLENIFDFSSISGEMEKYNILMNPLTFNIYSRDFTINTLIQDLEDLEVYDVTGYGIRDIENKIIRTPVNPEISTQSNPIIILRAIRFSLRYNYMIDKRLVDAMKNHYKIIFKKLSGERIQLELLKMLKENYDGTLKTIKEFNMEEILSNKDYDIFNVLDKVNLDNYKEDFDELVSMGEI